MTKHAKTLNLWVGETMLKKEIGIITKNRTLSSFFPGPALSIKDTSPSWPLAIISCAII